ncbi:hypothetical protein [Egbenema bharatensis]|uniref:hypothetical protein n=1 Tax=Egbenema bharatensis TaxID=3463334 RepID=UPI003A87B03A
MNVAPSFTPVSSKFTFIPEWDEFLSLFPHRGSYLWAPKPSPGKSPEWHTETRHLLSDRLINQSSYLYGVRFGKQTNYLMLDIDRKSHYHPYRDPFAICRILEALEPLGLVSFVSITSSYSGGLHLYFPFIQAQPSWKIAHAAKVLLENRGFKCDRGQLELFPNARRCDGAEYNGHRLPLQDGSYLLDEDWQPMYSTPELFVQHWNHSSYRNDCTEAAIDLALRKNERRLVKKLPQKAQKFLADLNAEIEPGWTGYGQTNHLLGRIAMREYIFHHALYGGHPLTGIALQMRILEVATQLPGYLDWCRHQHDIHNLAVYWARSIELHDRYYPYGGNAVLDPPQKTTLPSPNEQRAIDARERIRQAVQELSELGQFPKLSTHRFKALKQKGIGSDTLYKNKDLWYAGNSVKPLQDEEFRAVGEEGGDQRSPEPLKNEEFRAIAPISFVTPSVCPPQEGDTESQSDLAVGGARGGFPQPTAPTPHSPLPTPPENAAEPPSTLPKELDMVKEVLKRIREEKKQQRQEIFSSPPPDQHWWRQMQIELEMEQMEQAYLMEDG